MIPPLVDVILPESGASVVVVVPPAVIVAVVPIFTFTVAVTADEHPLPFVTVYVIVAEPAATPVTTPVVELKNEVVPVVASVVSTAIIEKSDSNLMYAQATANGYQLVDASPKVVYKLYATSRSDLFIAMKGNNQGVLIQKENQWFFEYYENEKLVSEKVAVKF